MPSALAESFSLFIPRMQMRIKADEVTVMLARGRTAATSARQARFRLFIASSVIECKQ
jgi:hypothetical protein